MCEIRHVTDFGIDLIILNFKVRIITLLFILHLNLLFGQDTTYIPFESKYHLNHDYRNYSNELENCVVFMPNRYHSTLVDGNYIFFDTLSNEIRLKGIVLNGEKSGKWMYYDSLGNLRIEDLFMNDEDRTLITNYYTSDGKLFRTKESSSKYLRTTHFNLFGMESYFYQNYLDSTNIQISFDSLGIIKYQSSMYKGQKHGTFLWRYDDGSLYAKQYFEYGKKEGVWLQGLKGDTKIWCTKEYKNDTLIKMSFYGKSAYSFHLGEKEVYDYYQNGNIRLKGKVIDGIIVGDWIYYDQNGQQVVKFKHDEKGNVTIKVGPKSVPGI